MLAAVKAVLPIHLKLDIHIIFGDVFRLLVR